MSARVSGAATVIKRYFTWGQTLVSKSIPGAPILLLAKQRAPDGVDSGVGDDGGADAAILAPRSPIKDARQGGEHDVTPVERQRALVEMGQPENTGGHDQRGDAADATFEEVLDPAAEEYFLRQRHGDESRDPGGKDQPGMVDAAMQVKKTKCEAEGNRDWDVEGELAEADAPIAPAQAQVESDAGKAAYREKGVEAGIEKSELAEESELVGPRRLQPAQIDRQTERDENQKVDEVTVLVGVERCRQPLQRGEDDRRKEIKQQPADGKVVQTN